MRSSPPLSPFRINRDSVQAQGLELVVSFAFRGGLAMPQGILASVTNTAPERIERDGGVGIDINAVSLDNFVDVAYPDAPFITASGLTVVWFGTIDNTLATNFKQFTGKHASAGSTNNPFDFRTDNSGSLQLHLIRANASSARDFRGPNASFSVFQVLACRVSDNLVQTVPDFFINGVKTAGTLVGGTPTGAVTGSGATIRIGRRPDGVEFDGFVSEVRYYNRWIPDDVIALMSHPRERFDLYRKRERTYFDGGGGAAAGSTFPALTVAI